jgi:hypothetical protein
VTQMQVRRDSDGTFRSVEDVASVAVMLATNGYMTGQTVSVNGGWYMSQARFCKAGQRIKRCTIFGPCDVTIVEFITVA